ncbi:MAG: tRNA epoxyqueuosine(34) reductase QueG [Clostridia bacterium]|nr:MAG: tRNA epoxyqueuosine(34) reductase QueG [Clostridia bacterium]
MLSLSGLRRLAQQAGLEVVGATSAAPLVETRALLAARQARGLVTPWVTADLEARCHPESVLLGARSVIMAALPYYHPVGFPAGGPRGRIARCAWGIDYHPVLRERLQLLARLLQRELGRLDFSIQVDNGPLVERALAVRAGLGFVGKNCSLIVPGYGSWVFLGAMVIDVEVEEALPGVPACGQCERCVRACPTGALETPYLVDPGRCLSYITQKGGEVPAEFRGALADRVYGCDTCQEVCRYNLEASGSQVKEFTPAGDSHAPLLAEVISLDRAAFTRRFGTSSLAWRGPNILARNAVIALGNSHHPEAVKLLSRVAQAHPSAMVRSHATQALAGRR